MDDNYYTTKLYDVVVPEHAFDDVMKLRQVFFVMEYISHDLTSLLKSPSRDDEKEEKHLILILFKCLRALEFIHENKVMHRDLKPANILIS
jgi:serine/threonine protein kinase